ncbi:MAG: hypothetical protein KA184_09920 [Candidatus Hydrogenedentes bacterium]|nr:hypothetical protein [Candidatus Hydrogenedentota bacterium]
MKYVLYFPLLFIVLVIYNVAMMAGANFQENATLISIPRLAQETPIALGGADLLVGLGIFLLFFEILKATRVSRTTIIDHMLSMSVFIIFLVELLVVDGAGTAPFILLMLISLLDVLAGFTISIATARRDLSIGSPTSVG